MSQAPYIGRFAPSPTGPLHAGSLVAAMASYLDARAHDGQWLVRMEDVDEGRTVPGAAEDILATLAALGMHGDGEVMVQSQRGDRYAEACVTLGTHVFPCACSRKEIADSNTGTAADGSTLYPGTCRNGLAPGKTARAVRLRVPEAGAALVEYRDRRLGELKQDLAKDVGDFVLFRADGFWAYQLAVVVDDADQGITHIVRGEDLLDSTARQIYLQRLLGFPTPQYLHVPVVKNTLGEKLSKQTGATALDLLQPVRTLQEAAAFLGLQVGPAASIASFWAQAIPAWRVLLQRWKA